MCLSWQESPSSPALLRRCRREWLLRRGGRGCCSAGARQPPGRFGTAETPSLRHRCRWGLARPAAPGDGVTSHHFCWPPLAAVPPSIIFGCPRSVRLGQAHLAVPPLPAEQQGPCAQRCGWVLPSSLPSQPRSPSPKSGSCWGSLGVDAGAAFPLGLAPRSAVAH